LFYLLSSDAFFEYDNQHAKGGKMPRGDKSMIEKYLIPIPSSKAQQEIVEKLDTFENLIQSLEQEIKLRKQQYEYYREKLLTFEKE
jgi:type I restriction enzyme S subunit